MNKLEENISGRFKNLFCGCQQVYILLSHSRAIALKISSKDDRESLKKSFHLYLHESALKSRTEAETTDMTLPKPVKSFLEFLNEPTAWI